jgi:hypothetical protein
VPKRAIVDIEKLYSVYSRIARSGAVHRCGVPTASTIRLTRVNFASLAACRCSQFAKPAAAAIDLPQGSVRFAALSCFRSLSRIPLRRLADLCLDI